ncbi:tyrosine-type recombinase/integrase [Zoogloea dura]|nr:site-specific integrase [Zoogloea dura]
MKALPEGRHLTSPDFPGLRLVSSSAGKSWIYRFKNAEGKMKQVKVGEWPAMSVHSAVAEWEKLRLARNAGQDPAEAKQEARRVRAEGAAAKAAEKSAAAYTVATVCNDYYRGYVRLARAKKGADEVARMFDKMLGDIGQVPAHTLSRAQAFELIQAWAEKAPVQAKKLRMELGAAWDYAIDAGALPETTPNWWRRILKGKIRSRGKVQGGERIGLAKRVLSEGEVIQLIRWLPNFTSIVEDALVLYLWTGTRGSEICGMAGNEIQQETSGIWWWTVPKERTKNVHRVQAVDLRVPLFGRAQDVILRRKARYGDGPLFPARGLPGKSIDQRTVGVAVHFHQPYSETTPARERPRLPVSNWSPHDLRRTARTMLAAMGCPDEVGEAILGHVPPGIVGVYNRHTYDAERVTWLMRLADHLERLASTR